jgi:hypothetical protein
LWALTDPSSIIDFDKVIHLAEFWVTSPDVAPARGNPFNGPLPPGICMAISDPSLIDTLHIKI